MTSTVIRDAAFKLGFSQCGFARCEPLEDLRDFYRDFIADERLSTLSYLARYEKQRLDPDLLLPGARTVICVTMSYFQPRLIPAENNFILSRYAYGRDYHRLMKDRIGRLENFIRSLSENVRTRSFVDSGPVLEKAWARRCGIGWQGKNSLVISKSHGSFFFIGIILTDLEAEPGEPGKDLCGRCDRCVKACPVGALATPYWLDITRCISYHTLETKTAIPEEIRSHLGGRIYGCDICQEACPHNSRVSPHTIPEFLPSAELVNMRKEDWTGLTEEKFNRLFADSPVKRIGYETLMRNIRANMDEQEGKRVRG